MIVADEARFVVLTAQDVRKILGRDVEPVLQEPLQPSPLVIGEVTEFPKHPVLYSLLPSKKIFNLIMSNRFYRLRVKNQDLTHTETFLLRKMLQNLELTFKDRKFSGEEPILIFDFLTRLVEESYTLDITEGQLMVFLSHVLSVISCDQDRAGSNGS